MPIGSIIGGLIRQGGANQAAGTLGAAGAEAEQNADFIRRLNQAYGSFWQAPGAEASNLISQLLGIGRLVPFGGSGGVRVDPSNWQQDQQNAFARFQPSPDYQFRYNEGLRALDRSAAARGGLLSGAQTKAAQAYGGNLASGEFNNWFNKLSGVASTGLDASKSIMGSNLGTLGEENKAVLGTAVGQAGYQQSGANALGSSIGNAFQNLLSLGSFTGLISPGMFGGSGSIYAAGGAPGGAAAQTGNPLNWVV